MKEIIKNTVIVISLVTFAAILVFAAVNYMPKRFSKEHLQSLGFQIK